MQSSGTMVSRLPDLAELEQRLSGKLISPDDDGYDEARKVWNGSIDRRPLFIARCSGTADVMAAVGFARDNGLLVAVRGGGHNVAGNAVCDGGMVIDLSGLKGIWIDPATRTARVQPGVTWGEFDREAQAFGLATPGGLVSMTGVAGFTLGGGIGWLSRKYGAASDNLLSVDVVTAEGRHLRASESENEDLFWGVRGGGGNFGIATSFEFQLHQVGPEVLGGMMFYSAEHAHQLLRIQRDHLASAPDELFSASVLKLAPPAPFLPAQVHGTSIVILGVCWVGEHEEGLEFLSPLSDMGEPLANLVAMRPYTQLQSMLDAGWLPGFQNYWKAQYLSGLPDDAIETVLSKAAEITSPLSDLKVFPIGGAFGRLGEEDSAMSHRSAPWVININSRWVDPHESGRHMQWTRELWSAVRPFSTGGVYVNFLGDEGEDRVREAYGPAKYERLVALKNKYDPTNLFRLNQNIKPTFSAR
ncbi:MAG: FAD-binding oxidoreductase [Actinomycetota bacterium]